MSPTTALLVGAGAGAAAVLIAVAVGTTRHDARLWKSAWAAGQTAGRTQGARDLAATRRLLVVAEQQRQALRKTSLLQPLTDKEADAIMQMLEDEKRGDG